MKLTTSIIGSKDKEYRKRHYLTLLYHHCKIGVVNIFINHYAEISRDPFAIRELGWQTPTKKVWDKFRKVKGNLKLRTISLLERRGNRIPSSEEIEVTFADHYANISKDPHKKIKQGKNRKKQSYHIINHSQTENWKQHLERKLFIPRW